MQVRAIVAMLAVASVQRSIDFYAKLGFTVGNTFAPPGAAEPSWAWLQSGQAQVMVSKATEPVVASQQAVMFYVYCEDVAAARSELLGSGVEAGEIAFPFYAPRGEFRLTDPDGYVLMITHT
jgi:catechol 2,3-dioxygenase-like lactoylglutathione lyase family enzyme